MLNVSDITVFERLNLEDLTTFEEHEQRDVQLSPILLFQNQKQRQPLK